MRIETVAIENINSLAGRFEIDLCDRAYTGGLFAIVGPSGAGKTTVLDAICLALYGKTPRVATVSDTQDELMNKNAQQCSAQAVFTVRGRRYKAVFAHARSSGSKPYRAAKRELYEQKPDGWHVVAARIREMDEKIEEVTGLDFSRFTRSIMLAQFRFAEFLQAGSNERAEILEQITDMDIYRRISAAAYERTKRQKEALERMQTRIGEVRLLSAEQETVFSDEQARLGTLTEAHGALAAALRSCESGARALDGLRRKLGQFSEAQHKLEEAAKTAQNAQAKAAQQHNEQQEAHEKLMQTLKDVRALDLRIQAHRDEITRIDKEIDEDNAQTRSHKKTILDIFRKYFPEADDELYKTLYFSEDAGEKLKQSAAGDLEHAKAQVQHIREKIKAALMHKDEAYWQTRAEALRIAIPLFEARDAMEKRKGEQKAQQALHSRYAKEAAEAQDALRHAQERFDHARLEQRFGEARRELKDGQPCPLCGAEHHPYAGGPDAESRFDEAQKQYNAAAAHSKRCDDLVMRTHARMDELCRQIDEKAQAVSTMSAALEKLGGIAQADIKALVKALGEAENVLRVYGGLQKSLSEASGNVAALAEKFGSVDKDVDAIAMQRQMIGGIAQRSEKRAQQRQAAQDGLKALKAQRIALFGDKNADTEEAAAHARLKQAQTHMEQSREAAEQARRDADKNRADIERTQKDTDEQQKLLESAYADVRGEAAAVQTVSNDDDVTERHAAFADAAARLGAKPDIEAMSAAAHALALLVSAEEKRRGVVGQILKTNAESKADLKALKHEEAAHKQVLKKWEALSALIGSADGTKFSRMAQSITFDALLNQANTVLARLSDRYVLVRGEGGAAKPLELAVADMYQAGDVRPVVNLSGGESFIVSLALALGLSEMSAGAARIDSLFIDEGFASLDEAYMEAALQTLCALGMREGKLIGVISHMEALKERIDVQIELRRLPGGRATLSGPGVTAQPG